MARNAVFQNLDPASSRSWDQTSPLSAPLNADQTRFQPDNLSSNTDQRGSDRANGTGSITLTRHGQPALSRDCVLSSDQYRQWWADYEMGGLVTGQIPPDSLIQAVREADEVHVSTRLRARETAHAVVGNEPVVLDELYIEAPLPPPKAPSWLKMSPRCWGVVSRLTWHMFNHHQGQESRRQAEARAALVAVRLIERAEKGNNVLLFAHGYFNHMIGQQLKAHGWRLSLDQGFKYWCQRRFDRA